MSVFTMIRRGRAAAKEHKTKKVETEKKETQTAPYKHVPTHALSDALAGAPQSWRQEDRPRILEENRRRSAMAASGLGMHTGIMTPVHVGLPRTNSSLSHVSYPHVYANPVVAMPRNYSYASIQSNWNDRNGEAGYSPMEQNRQFPTTKGKEVERIVLVDSARASRTSSKATSPVGSSNDSTSSSDDLEIKTVKHPRSAQRSRPPSSSRNEMPHRLHPSRRLSDASAPGNGPPSAHQPYHQPRSNYYPPSASHSRPSYPRQNSAPLMSPGVPPSSPGIPPVPAIPATLSHPTASSSSQSLASSLAMAPTSSGPLAAQPVPSNASNSGSSAHSTPRMLAATPSYADSIPDFAPIPRAITDPALPMSAAAVSTMGAQRPSAPRRLSKTARFTEADMAPRPVQGSASPLVSTASTRASVAPTTLPTDFDETSFVSSPVRAPAGRPRVSFSASPVVVAPPPFPSAAVPSAAAPAKGNRLSKGPKPPKADVPSAPKKSRWSFRTSKQTAIAV